jgi:hypothetical protein
MIKNKLLSDICFISGLVSIATSISMWYSVDHNTGIYVGLWVPTLLILSIKFEEK